MSAIIKKNSGHEIFTGIVDRFNFNERHIANKIFWVDGDDWRSGWCKGKVDLHRGIRVGDRVRLTGSWRLDQRYPAFGEQFFFSSYAILPASEPSRNMPGLESKPIEIKGVISNMIKREGTARIFYLINTSDGKRYKCFGRVIPGMEILIGDELNLTGVWQPDKTLNGRDLFYDHYERIKK